MAQPRSCEELIRDIGSCSTPPPSEAVRLVEALTALVRDQVPLRIMQCILIVLQPNHLRTVALFNGFFQGMYASMREGDE